MMHCYHCTNNCTWVTELDFPIKPSHWAYVPQKVVNLADCIIKGKESNG